MLLARSLHRATRGQSQSLLRLPQTILVASQAGNPRPLLLQCQKLPLRQQRRCYAKPPPRRPAKEEPLIPSKLLVYHAGTGRITFLACLKLTSIFLGAYQLLFVLPAQFVESSASAPPSVLAIASVAAAGIVPVLWIWATTRPFVTHIHLELPPAAQASRASLERFVRDVTPNTPLVLTTINPIGKPHYSTTSAGKLVPTRRLFGLINYDRVDTARENRARRWYMFPAMSGYYIQPTPAATKGKAQGTPGKGVDTWVWDAVVEKLEQREKWHQDTEAAQAAAKKQPKSRAKR